MSHFKKCEKHTRLRFEQFFFSNFLFCWFYCLLKKTTNHASNSTIRQDRESNRTRTKERTTQGDSN